MQAIVWICNEVTTVLKELGLKSSHTFDL